MTRVVWGALLLFIIYDERKINICRIRISTWLCQIFVKLSDNLSLSLLARITVSASNSHPSSRKSAPTTPQTPVQHYWLTAAILKPSLYVVIKYRSFFTAWRIILLIDWRDKIMTWLYVKRTRLVSHSTDGGDGGWFLVHFSQCSVSRPHLGDIRHSRLLLFRLRRE